MVEVRKLSRDEVLPEIQRLDLLILGGGGILFDGEAQVFLREVMLAHEHRVPVMVYAISAGPLKDAAAQAAVRDGLSRAAVVTVRERGARQALEDAGVHREILVTADPALLLEPQPLPKDALGAKASTPDVSWSACPCASRRGSARDRRTGVSQAAGRCRRLHGRPLRCRRCSCRSSPGWWTCSTLTPVAQMLRAQRATVLKGEYTSGQLLALMGHFAFAVGMRLHFLIFASLQNLPFVALPYAPRSAVFSTTWASRCRRSSK